MNKDIQKPILYKADPDVYMIIEDLKDRSRFHFNRNRLINDAVRLYLELIKLMHKPEYGYLNEVSFNDAHLQRILYERLRNIATHYSRFSYPLNKKNSQSIYIIQDPL